MKMHGKNGRVAIADSSPIAVIAGLNKWTLNMPRDYVEVTEFGAKNKAYVAGLPDISGTISGFLDLDSGSPASGGSVALLEVAESGVESSLRLFPEYEQLQDRFWEGPALIDASIDVSANGAVTLAGNFRGSGNWSRN